MEWSIHELSTAAGTTSRTLRHYGELGLLEPTRLGANGYRYYDQSSLLRLQRILILRELGVGLGSIADILHGQEDTAEALRGHLEDLRRDQERLGRQIASVSSTIEKLERGEALMATESLNGFDHTQYKDEVVERWGKEAYESGDRWWRSMSDDDKKRHHQVHLDLVRDYGEAQMAGRSVDSDEVQDVVRRHYDWIAASGTRPGKDYFTGLGQMYVDDPRFGANYTTQRADGAEYVRDAMKVYAERNL
ncbi:DNA-binding transcriptional MerR regulator [Antricoccus suffuscus]|uniref:DNA-binding transcriptional MerR regulator n=1 Tax=Antricoccus suffuscus TaxID=1629062 RepID=A0A2T1A6B5_9ACTN|nr:MerR family transcriptional regulator [Antricoccus suffuscus]PRZ44152.1 DNA-binding transcriptional MerR regulator [Antricoccus suffuscus]